MIDIELRHKPDEKWATSADMTKIGDGQIGIMYEVEKCVSAWVEFFPDGGTSPKYTAVILPADSPQRYLPYLANGGTFRIHASVGMGGFFRAKVFEG